MSTFLLLHGAASSGWYWHLVEPLLVSAGHEAVTPDLPADEPSAGPAEYVATAIDGLEGHHGENVILVAQFDGWILRTGYRSCTSSCRNCSAGGHDSEPGRAGS